MKKNILFACTGLLACLMTACSQTVYNDEPYDLASPEEQDTLDVYETELYENYRLLDVLYLYAHSRDELADDYKVYLNKGTSENIGKKKYCTQPLIDVCYMYAQMSDPYTRYYDPSIAQQVWQNFVATEVVVGIGAEVEEITDSNSRYLQISEVYPKSPSAKAGLQEGDIVYMVDGVSVSTQANFEAMCTGNINDVIKIMVGRDADTVIAAVTLAEYNTPTVSLHYEDSIPVIQIKEFVSNTTSDSGTYGEFVTALRKTEGAPSTIIDLRDNPGGDISQCYNISSEFLSEGDTIILDVYAFGDSIKVDGKWKVVQAFDTSASTAIQDGLAKGRYYVFLADTGTASCAEVLLESSAAYLKTPIVGMTTYGKAIGQSIGYTPGGGLVYITDVIGYDKNWKTYHDLGIVPDYKIDDPDEQMAKAVELAKKAKEKRTAGYGTKRIGHFAKTRTETASGKIPTLKDLKMMYRFIENLK